MLFRYFLTIFLILTSYLQAQQTNKWETYFEISGYKSTPAYDETIAYFRQFEEAFPQVRIFSIGKSPQGRDINCVVVSKEKAFTPEAARHTGKPVIMIIAGIHSGEIEGKDAAMLLMRDIFVTKNKEHLIDNVTLLLIPVFSVDGHERRSPYNRINQQGPEEMGWRTTAVNLNLNRDWLKADAVEMQHLLNMYNQWLPDFLIDSHTTNGADYQYTVTYSMEKYRNIYRGTALWSKYSFIPYLKEGVEGDGFLISPYVIFNKDVPDSGIIEYAAPPRFSTGYAAVQNRPALLIETHMMKPYKERVFATLSVLNTTLQYFYDNPGELKKINMEADERTIKELAGGEDFLPVSFVLTENPKQFLYKGIEALQQFSEISGSMKTVYTGNKYEKMIPHYDTVFVTDSIAAPEGYLIPKEWSILVERLRLHGVRVEEMKNEETMDVKRYRFYEVKLASNSYEGRQRIEYNYVTFNEEVVIPPGTYRVPAEQRTIKVIMHLLQPESEDSFLRWGFMNSIFEQKEYFEMYVMEREAEKMLVDNPKLKTEFEERLKEEKFRNSPYQRLNFFYERSPWYDKNFRVYPVMIIE
jgi:hypothetical protein